MAVILLTGASSGIGFAAAKELSQRGHTVYAAARRLDKLNLLADFGAKPVELDVTSSDSIQHVVAQVVDEQGRIDVLINNAGFGFYGAVEDVDLDDARRQFDVNVFGLAEITKAVLPTMRRQGSGRIINVSSMGGRLVAYFGAWYHASKYAVEALSDALRMETSDFGIDVVLIEPGAIKTAWDGITAHNLRESAAGGAYEKQANKAADGMEKLYKGKLVSGPKVVVDAMVKAVEATRPKTRYTVGFGAKPAIFAHALLPDRLFDRLMKNIV